MTWFLKDQEQYRTQAAQNVFWSSTKAIITSQGTKKLHTQIKSYPMKWVFTKLLSWHKIKIQLLEP